MVNSTQNHSSCPVLKLIIHLMARRGDALWIFCRPKRRRIITSYFLASSTGLRCGGIQKILMSVSLPWTEGGLFSACY